jgi:hypothetical protein
LTGVKGDGSGSLPPCLCWHWWWRRELSHLSPPDIGKQQ